MPRVGSKPRTRARKMAASQLDGVNGDDVADRICGTIAAAIAEGALRPGNKILEDVLADHFRVSRTVVRGALKFTAVAFPLAWSFMVLAVSAKHHMSSVSGFLLIETAFLLVQYVVVSPLIALAFSYRKV